MAEEDKTIVRPEHQEFISREAENPDVARKKIHIPDYVMQDFGFPKKTRSLV